MKKQLIDFVKGMGGAAHYHGAWPATMYITHPKGCAHVEAIIDAAIRKFTRHTPFRLMPGKVPPPAGW